MAQAMFMKIRLLYSVDELHVLAPPSTLPLTQLMPEVDDGISLAIGHGELRFGERLRISRILAANSYDWAIITPRSIKSALVPFLAGIKRRTGFLGEMRFGLINDVRPERHTRAIRTVDRILSLVPAVEGSAVSRPPTPRLVVPERYVEEALAVVGIARPSSPVLALCPGADYGPAKRWPVRHFASLAAEQQRKGWTIWVLGSKNDRAIAAEICDHAGGSCHNLAGLTRIDQAAALMTLSDAVVSNDSGLMHVAAALRKQTVGLFGPSSPERTPPLTNRGAALWLGLGCSPCFKRRCPLGHTECLNQLTPEMVSSELERGRVPPRENRQ